MIPWEHIETVEVPGNGGTLRLSKRGEEFSITVDRYEIMNSRVHGSAEALAQLACARLPNTQNARILVGGLGMGYTLAETLKQIGPRGEAVVAELVPAVVKWNRGPLAHLAGYPLNDGRTAVREVDVAQILREEHMAYDAILLDVDNGPEGLARKANNWLYAQAGLEAARDALRPKGILAVWSAAPSGAFTRRMRSAGFWTDEICVGERGPQNGPRNTIFIGSMRVPGF
jgi:spermidine synthase